MLQRLVIKNVALVDYADISFSSKLNILSGETGAGKSIILDCINFILGAKAEKSMIRSGESEASVRAEFFVKSDNFAFKILDKFDIESDGNIVISRKISLNSRGSIKINGMTVTNAMLREVTQYLVDVHGQSDHFILLDERNQLKVIDNLARPQIISIKEQLKFLIEKKNDVLKTIKSLGGSEQEREIKIDLYNYQINEITEANIFIGEYDELIEKRAIALNTEKIVNVFNNSISILEDDNGIIDNCNTMMRLLNSISSINSKYYELGEKVSNLKEGLEEIAQDLQSNVDEIQFDEIDINYIEERLSIYQRLRRKYGISEEQILNYLEDTKSKLDLLLDSANLLEKCNKEVEEINKKIYNKCLELTAFRKDLSIDFSNKVIEQLKSLNINSASFSIDFNDYDITSADINNENGADIIRFMFSANKGEPLKPMSKIISGGELSRFMLAIKTLLTDFNGIETYIFDEIDTGISGNTARAVAEKLRAISLNTQAIVVSHLPQVCAASVTHFLIYKIEKDNKTFTNIKQLSSDEKIGEIVRLLGSIDKDSAFEYAKNLINSYK